MTKEKLETGELYLFSDSDPQCSPENSLWGIYDCREGEIVRLEVMMCPDGRFEYNCTLPAEFSHVRKAGRGELRDFSFNYGYDCCLRNLQLSASERNSD